MIGILFSLFLFPNTFAQQDSDVVMVCEFEILGIDKLDEWKAQPAINEENQEIYEASYSFKVRASSEEVAMDAMYIQCHNLGGEESSCQMIPDSCYKVIPK